MSKPSKKQESLKKKHWSIKSQESLISRNRDGHFCLNVEGGAEVGLFPFVGDIRQDRIHYNRGKIHAGELILSVNNKRVPGMVKKDVISLIKRSADPVSLVTVRQNATITRDIRQYLATRFTKASVDSELQHQIRENLHMRVVPCTTRQPQPGERHGVDYNFISVDEFKRMEKSGELLESGVYEGNYYGTPRPPADPPSNINLPAYSRSPASMGYSKEGKITANSLSPSTANEWSGPPVANLPKNLGPLPPNWEIAYTETNEKYFIDHSTGTTHWLDPRLARYLKHSILECGENELPYGWEKVNDPVYGTYFIDHINRVTQYENPIIEAKRKHAGAQLPGHSNGPQNFNSHPPAREPPPSFHSTAALEKQREAEAAAMWPDAGLRDYTDSYPYPYPTPPSDQELEADLQGEVVTTTLTKTAQGFGFTIIGGDRPGELLQIKSIVRGSVAEKNGRLMVGDVLVRINGISVLTYSHRKVVELFMGLQLGSDVAIEVRRGYPLPDAARPPEDLPSYNDSYPPEEKGPEDRVIPVTIIKGPLGFGFSLGESPLGPVVKQIMDHPRCAQLCDGDVLLEVNGENVQSYAHTELVDVLKRCPKGNQASFLILRPNYQNEEDLPSYPDGGNNPPQSFNSGEPFKTMEIRLIRQVSGFGFRIIGGREEGSQATVGAIVSGGAADVDGRLLIGDEITHINNHSVMDASHRDVISLMGQAAALGEVVLGIRRKMPLPETLSPTSGVTGGPVFSSFEGGPPPPMLENSALPPPPSSGQIPQGIREVVVDRPNVQTSFGFVLQSNTLRAGCMICRLIPGSPAERSGKLYMYDELLAVNDTDVSRMDHGDIVTLIKASSTQIKLCVQQPEDLDAVTKQQMLSEQQAQDNFGSPPGQFQSPSHQPGRGYPQNYTDGPAGAGGYPMGGHRQQGFQDFPGGEEEQPPQISADLSDIASDDEEIHHIEIRRSGGGFGFSIRGGAEYNSPLCVLRIADGGAAEKHGSLRVGDELLEINGNSTENMLHSDAITIIKHGGDSVKLIIRRLAEEPFMGSAKYDQKGHPQDGVMFSPSAMKDHYGQDFPNSTGYGNRRSGSRDPHSPPGLMGN